MGSIRVQVNPVNPGTVNVHVWLASSPGGTPLDQRFEATREVPLDKTFDNLQPALYAVTISWSSGYQNVASAGGPGNNIVVNGKGLYYQVLGAPVAGQSISAVFGCQVS